jgi:hypothetical protein
LTAKGQRSQRLGAVDNFMLQKMFPGTQAVPYIAQGHAQDVASQIMSSNYLLPTQIATLGYSVAFYAPTIFANSTSRWSGFQWFPS